ncbi:MAG TPA: BTAD domain-containing putative transcriptional regulator [Gemmatimonadales bacterium]|nr:BTAD domain-containing putative transcriptional regulator [Gemmatimonadales bacterium]
MIRIRALGGLSVTRDGTALTGAATQPRRLAVLALIARSGERGVTRERLLAMLWPDTPEEGARRALSQALHALRTDLGAEDLFLGVQELRLNLAAASCDVLEFDAALAAGAWNRAAAAYGGPFLDGFRLAGAGEFDRWMEEERAHLAERHANALERLAAAESARGDVAGAAGWWRRRAALDPLNARVTVQLMRALDAAGERHAALQQARIYETLLEQELALEPDAEVVRYAEELRAGARSGAGGTAGAAGAAGTAVRAVRAVRAEPPPAASAASARRWAPRVALALGALVIAVVAVLAGRARRQQPGAPLLAVGAIADYRGTGESSEPLTDMLATNLARVPGIQVVSGARLLELLAHRGEAPDASGYAAAAREAGATDLMEGGVHTIEGGRVLLELRRVNLATGTVTRAYRLTGDDAFALVEEATAEIAASLGRSGTALDPADISTRSLVAYRFYEEGLRSYAHGDYRGAIGLLETALREDSAFAMAAYYRLRARAILNLRPDASELAALGRLSEGASERERLQIQGWIAFTTQSPALDAIADTLAIRYPAEVEGQYLAGFARMARADFAEAVPYLERVIALDSSALAATRGPCLACEAMQLLGFALFALDSLPRVEALARDWIRRDPESATAWALLGSVQDASGNHEEAIATRRRAMANGPFDVYDVTYPAAVRIRAGDFAGADRTARAALDNPRDEETAWQAKWIILLSLRYQARWREADSLLDEWQASLTPAERQGERGRLLRTSEALVRFESGAARAAVAILDSATRHPEAAASLGVKARFLTLQYALLAEAAERAGDAGTVARAADSSEAWAERSGKTRDRGIARHARAVDRLIRRDTAAAMADFQAAIYSTTVGYTRTNARLGALFLARGRAREAEALLRAALKGSLESANLYVTHTELHELLGRAHQMLGQRDSARAHFRYVASALAGSDPGARPRLERARAVLKP